MDVVIIQFMEYRVLIVVLCKCEKMKLILVQLNVILWLVLVGFLLIWEVVFWLGLILLQVLFVFSVVVVIGWCLLVNGLLFQYLGVSFVWVVVGFVIGGGIGFVLGVLVGFLWLVEVVLDRFIQMICVILFLVMLLLVIVWFGVDEMGKIFMVLLVVMFFIYINIVLGICQVDLKLLELVCVIGLLWNVMICWIILLGVMLLILIGVCYVLVVVWLVLVIVEIVVIMWGIGFLVMDVWEFL